jgi:hypothetical protein
MLDDDTTMTSTPGLSKSFTQGGKLPVSKPGLRTSWGHVGGAVAVTVTVVVAVDTEVTVWVDGGRVMSSVTVDAAGVSVRVVVEVEVTVEAGIVGGQVLEPGCVMVVVTVEGAGHVLEVGYVEVELVDETEEELLQPVTNPPILATTHPTDLDVDVMLGHVLPIPVTDIVLVVVAVVVWSIVTSCVLVVVSVVVLKSVVVSFVVLKSVVVFIVVLSTVVVLVVVFVVVLKPVRVEVFGNRQFHHSHTKERTVVSGQINVV